MLTVSANEITHNRCYVTSSTKSGRLRTLSNAYDFQSRLACWSSGMILALGARGSGFDSRTGPNLFPQRNYDDKFLAGSIPHQNVLFIGGLHLFSDEFSHAATTTTMENLIHSPNCRYGWDIQSIFPSLLCFLLGFP